MNDALFIAPLAVAIVLAIGLVLALMALARTRAAASGLERDLAVLQERARLIEEQGRGNAEVLRAQAAQSAGVVADQLVHRASETFKSQELLAQQRLEAQLKPVAETLKKFEAQVTAMEKARAEDTGGLKAQIAEMLKASTETQFEARKLSQALKRGAGVQGRWGEQMLRNVLEAAGLQNRFDFDEQVSLSSDEGRRRPDVTVRMPSGGVLVIDAKCSLNAFLEAQDATDDALREAAFVRHAQSVKDHVRGLSAKAYWEQFERTPDIVAMFLPGDGYLAAALERQPDLLSDAMGQRVVLVTPSTLFALCKAVAYGWRVEDQAKGAADIAAIGRELYKRIAVMGGHTAALGKALESAVGKYNQFVGSLESNVMTQARRFEDLAADHEGKALPVLEPVEVSPRALVKLAAEDSVPDPLALTQIAR